MNKKSNGRGYKNRNQKKDFDSAKSKAKYTKECDQRDDRKSDTMPGRNDFAWYNKYPNLTVAAAQFPFPYKPGMSIDYGPIVGSEGSRTLEYPGVMALDWFPSIGKCTRGTDAAAVASKELYAAVRKVYSGRLTADAPDFMIYLACLDSVFTYIAYLKRVYRIVNAYSPSNYMTPDGLLRAMGFTNAAIRDMRKNKQEFWQNINTLILMTRKFQCPAVMDLFNRHYWMSDNVYTDSPTANAQFYIFNLSGVFSYEQVKMPDGEYGPGAAMIRTPWAGGAETTITNLYDFGRTLIDKLVAWDDSYTISGYLMRAFEGVPSFTIEQIDIDSPFIPQYDELVLAQIENSRTIPYGAYFKGGYLGFEGLMLSQDVSLNIPIWDPQYSSAEHGNFQGAGGATLPPQINSREERPTIVGNVEATRLLAGWTTEPDTVVTGNIRIFIDAGTEIPLCWRMVNTPQPNFNTAIHSNAISQIDEIQLGKGDRNDASYRLLLTLLHMERFDWHPFAWITTKYYTDDSDTEGTVGFNVSGDIHNLTVITNDDLTNLHDVCVYSELNAFDIS